MKYAVVIEKGESSYGGYVPDIPGCVAAADTREETLRLIPDAIEFDIQGLKKDGNAIPEPAPSIQIAA